MDIIVLVHQFIVNKKLLQIDADLGLQSVFDFASNIHTLRYECKDREMPSIIRECASKS